LPHRLLHTLLHGWAARLQLGVRAHRVGCDDDGIDSTRG